MRKRIDFLDLLPDIRDMFPDIDDIPPAATSNYTYIIDFGKPSDAYNIEITLFHSEDINTNSEWQLNGFMVNGNSNDVYGYYFANNFSADELGTPYWEYQEGVGYVNV